MAKYLNSSIQHLNPTTTNDSITLVPVGNDFSSNYFACLNSAGSISLSPFNNSSPTTTTTTTASNSTRMTGGICSVLLEVVEKLCDEEEVLSDATSKSFNDNTNYSSFDSITTGSNSHIYEQNKNSTMSGSQMHQATTTMGKKSGNKKERRNSRSSAHRTVRHIKDLLNCSDELRQNTIEIQQNNPKRKRKTPTTSENVNVLNQSMANNSNNNSINQI